MMPDSITTIYRNYADILDGPWYESDPAITALIEPHIPSDRDMEQQFRARLVKWVPGTELIAGGANGRHVTVGDEVFRRNKRYLRIFIPMGDCNPMEPVLSNRRIADVTRAAYLEAADVLADTVAAQVAEVRFKHEHVVVRTLSSGLMHHKTGEGVRRLGVDMHSDAAVAIIAAYYVVCPVWDLEALP